MHLPRADIQVNRKSRRGGKMALLTQLRHLHRNDPRFTNRWRPRFHEAEGRAAEVRGMPKCPACHQDGWKLRRPHRIEGLEWMDCGRFPSRKVSFLQRCR